MPYEFTARTFLPGAALDLDYLVQSGQGKRDSFRSRFRKNHHRLRVILERKSVGQS
jgi:hypothetical protein